MQIERARWLTVHRIILGDMLLNWLLGAALLAFPQGVDRLIGQAPVLPVPVYRLLGAAFVLFAAWQTWVVRQGKIGPAGLIFAALMALIPFVLLTIALVFVDLPLRPLWRIILWAGNIYMFGLGSWYLTLARIQARRA